MCVIENNGIILILLVFLIPIGCFILIVIYQLMNSPYYTYKNKPRFPKIPEKYQRNKKDEKEV